MSSQLGSTIASKAQVHINSTKVEVFKLRNGLLVIPKSLDIGVQPDFESAYFAKTAEELAAYIISLLSIEV